MRLGEGNPDIWSYAPGQLECLEVAKTRPGQRLLELLPALRRDRRGPVEPGLRLYRRRTGQERMASETMNCAAPDTGNMEVLERVGTP